MYATVGYPYDDKVWVIGDSLICCPGALVNEDSLVKIGDYRDDSTWCQHYG